jgi:acyl carrier protein
VNWPLWEDGGMHADDATRAMLARQWGMHAMSRTSGLDALGRALATDLSQVLVIEGDPARIREVFLESRPVQSHPAAAVSSQSAPSTQGLRETLKHALSTMVSSLIKVKPEDLDGDTSFNEYGFDSISLTGLANALNRQYGLDLMPTLFFEYSTLDGLAGYLEREHRDALAPRFVSAPAEMPVRDISSARPRRGFAAAVATPSPAVKTPVAIIGISGRFPMAEDIDAFWRNLAEGRDCISPMPASRTHWLAWHGERAPESHAVRGGFIDGVDEFDPAFFGISPREAELMDPQQRLMMIHVWKALEDAGYAASSLAGSDLGLYVGTMPSGYATLASRAGAAIEGYSSTGTVASVGPNRMSYFLGVHGPSEPVETACSSSLIALRRAVLAIERGDCTMAIAGGVNTIVNPELHISFERAGMLSQDARCKTFSAAANGYVRGEGVAMLVLKKLSDAERDGDHIYGA